MAREMKQEMEWSEAQKIEVNVDLVDAAKKQLQFLATVDQNRWLYKGRGLDRAIYRYNAFWLPLLAKHSEAPLFEGPLVAPLDCEWIWHCHRLNPVRYKTDCEELYGKTLDNSNVVSSIQGTLKKDTEEVWNNLYPTEPYELDSTASLEDNVSEKMAEIEKCTKYDLISAVERQTPFFSQVSRPHMNNDLYLEGAVARYKGFLHLIKRNNERSIRSFSVPTYDIDLIWHTHQLHPISYCNDLLQIVGKVLEHDDTDSDRTKGKKLDTGFSGTTKNWEELYGSRYWRAGAMYKGATPSPVQNMDLSESKVIEVMLEFVSVKNLNGHKGSLFVLFSKTQPDTIFDAKRSLTIWSETGVKQVASFDCQPNGDLLFELMIRSPSDNPLSKQVKVLGSGSISLEDLMLPKSGLVMEKWLDMMPDTNMKNSEPISLRVAISVTSPTPISYLVKQPGCKGDCGSGCGSMVKSGACGIGGAGGGCGSMVKSGACGVGGAGGCGIMVESGACGVSGAAGGCGSMVKSGACGVSGAGGGCGSMVKSGACGVNGAKSGACGVSGAKSGACGVSGAGGGCGSMAKSGACGIDVAGGGCGSMVKSGARDIDVAGGGCGSMVKSGACGINVAGGGCGSMVKSGACGVGGVGRGCGSMVKSGACGVSGVGGGCGIIAESAGCGISGAAGGCGTMVKGGACGVSGAGGGCGIMLESGGCGVSGAAGGCGTMVNGGTCGVSGAGGGCGIMFESGGCGVSGAAGGCGTMVKGGACGVNGIASGCGATGFNKLA